MNFRLLATTAAIVWFSSFNPALGQTLSKEARCLTQQTIEDVAAQKGTDPQLLLALGYRESTLRPHAKSATTTATGVYQFTEATWLYMVARYGASYGHEDEAAAIKIIGGKPVVADPGLRKAILDLRYDVRLSTLLAADLALENGRFLESKLHRPITAGEVAVAHVLGAGAATRLIQQQDAQVPAAAIFPREAQTNPAIFHPTATPADVLRRLKDLSMPSSFRSSAC